MQVKVPVQEQSKLRLGQQVRVVGLQSRPELNGQGRTVVEWDEEQARWKVRMTDGTGKLLKEDHLEATVSTEEVWPISLVCIARPFAHVDALSVHFSGILVCPPTCSLRCDCVHFRNRQNCTPVRYGA